MAASLLCPEQPINAKRPENRGSQGRAGGCGWGRGKRKWAGRAILPTNQTAGLGGAEEALSSSEAPPWGPSWDCGYQARLMAPGLHPSARPAPGAPCGVRVPEAEQRAPGPRALGRPLLPAPAAHRSAPRSAPGGLDQCMRMRLLWVPGPRAHQRTGREVSPAPTRHTLRR